MRQNSRKTLGVAMAVALLWSASTAWAGDGAVALQTADPSCADESGDVYVGCGNGTVTDNRTGLVWLADAGCLTVVDWNTAMEFVAGLSDKPSTSAAADQDCGLSDGSSAGEWRLPSIEEWEAMTADALGVSGDPDCNASPPTITNDAGTGCYVGGPTSFSNVATGIYWSSTTHVTLTGNAWAVDLDPYNVLSTTKAATFRVWPVRGGQ
jgi:hypothetical protein